MNTIKVNRKDLDNSHTPAFDYCRKLLKEGVDPSTRLEIYRDRDTYDYAIPSIGEGGKYTVREEPKLLIQPFKQMDEKVKATLRSRKGKGSPRSARTAI